MPGIVKRGAFLSLYDFSTTSRGDDGSLPWMDPFAIQMPYKLRISRYDQSYALGSNSE